MGFLKSLFQGDNEKGLLKEALPHTLDEGDSFKNFIPFLKIWDQKGESNLFRCSAPTIEEAANMGYEIITKKKNTDSIKSYVLANVRSYRPNQENVASIYFESGLEKKEKASKFTVDFTLDENGIVKSKSSPKLIGNVNNALTHNKNSAWVVVFETGDFIKALTPLPTTILFLLCLYEKIEIAENIFNFLISELQSLLQEFPNNKAIVLATGHCLKALNEGRSADYAPEGAPSIELFKLSLHHSVQVLVEACKANMIPLDDLKICFANFREMLLRALSSNNVEVPAEETGKLINYIKGLSENPI